jgi:hypothetical protein
MTSSRQKPIQPTLLILSLSLEVLSVDKRRKIRGIVRSHGWRQQDGGKRRWRRVFWALGGKLLFPMGVNGILWQQGLILGGRSGANR